MTLVFSIMLSSKHLACFFAYYQDCIQEDNEPYAYPYPSLDNLRKRLFVIEPHLRFSDFLPYTLLWLILSRQLESARLGVRPCAERFDRVGAQIHRRDAHVVRCASHLRGNPVGFGHVDGIIAITTECQTR